jgi:hypothetical protein
MNHLLSKHKHKVKPALRDSKQPRIDEMITNQPSFSIEVFEEFLVDWIVLNDQPFTEVESESFRKLLTLLKTCCRNTCSCALGNSYKLPLFYHHQQL